MAETASFQHKVQLGVGEAIRRLIHIEFQYRQGVAVLPKEILVERDMIISALNQFELNIGFDCNNDGVPDTVEIFRHSVATSCCRLLPLGRIQADTSRAIPPEIPRKQGISRGRIVAEPVVEEPKKQWGLRSLFSKKDKE